MVLCEMNFNYIKHNQLTFNMQQSIICKKGKMHTNNPFEGWLHNFFISDIRCCLYRAIILKRYDSIRKKEAIFKNRINLMLTAAHGL